MPTSPLAKVARHLRTLAAVGEFRGLSDGELLERFADVQEELAFEVLMRRHGPLVLGVCRRALGAGPDAEDAFQATFLVLASKAASIRQQASVASWLYGVAFRLSRRLKKQNAGR